MMIEMNLFSKDHAYKPIEQYGQTLFDCYTKKIKNFTKEKPLYNDYTFDPVVFAWNIDPLAYKFPAISPYSAMNDNPILNIDPDGREVTINGSVSDQNAFVSMLNRVTGNTYAITKDNKLVRTNPELSLCTDKDISEELSCVIQNSIDIKDNVEINLVNNVNDMHTFDDFKKAKVDIADIDKSPDNAFLAGKLGHIFTEYSIVPDLAERNQVETSTSSYDKGHNPALIVEKNIVDGMQDNINKVDDTNNSNGREQEIECPDANNCTIIEKYSDVVYKIYTGATKGWTMPNGEVKEIKGPIKKTKDE